MRRGRVLTHAFFARDSLVVAPALLHKVLVHDDPVHGRVAARLVEVEAYRGSDDPGSHAFRGRTRRTAVMFGPAGHAYVYFVYGMHWCVNVVCGDEGEASAVLLRAGAPLTGIDVMRMRRRAARRDRDLTSGPARLCEALAITGAQIGADLRRGALRILDDGTLPPEAPVVTRRIGLRTGQGDELPWRFSVPDDPNVSRTG